LVDEKPFWAHVTLGRVKQDCGRKERLEMGKEIEKLRRMDIPQKWQVDRVNIYESTLESEESVYHIIKSVSLDKNELGR